MVYSPSVDGVFCKHCALMIPIHCRKDKGAFVNKPFINWHKLQEKAKKHEQMKYHQDAMIATESFLNSVENPEQNVNNRIDDEKRKNIIRNRHIVKWVSEAVLFCGRQLSIVNTAEPSVADHPKCEDLVTVTGSRGG